MKSGRVLANESVSSRAWRRLRWLVRDRFPSRPVLREVQGVRLYLPWSHRLPDYAAAAPEYGQNLVRLAELIRPRSEPLAVLDVGANVGDSTLQILNRVDGVVVCVEADEFYLGFLTRNVAADPRIAVEPRLLSLDEGAAMAPVRAGGTTRFEPVASGTAGTPTVSVAALKERHPSIERLRLVKSDTDGYDTVLVPAIAAMWANSTPVLFFEYDPVLTVGAGNDPEQVWPRLEALGYAEVAAWDNAGRFVGRWPITEWASHRPDDDPGRPVSDRYWDVAVAHRDDEAGRAALRTFDERSVAADHQDP